MRALRIIDPRFRGILVVLAAAVSIAAQGTGSIHGLVATPGQDGKPVYLPGARLSLSCRPGPPKPQTTASDDSGQFSFTGLAAGSCTVTATMPGFQAGVRTVTVTPNARLEVDLVLSLETVRQRVTVSAAAGPLIESGETSSGTEISNQTLIRAPVLGETFSQAAMLMPGVLENPDQTLTIKGTRPDQQKLLVSSANLDDPVTGAPSFDLLEDAIQSVRVQANPYDAEYGGFNGAITQVEAKSGENKFDFKLEDPLPRFRRRAGTFVGIESADPRVLWSGPIKKNRIYFFQLAEYDFLRTRIPGLGYLDKFLQSDMTSEAFQYYSRVDADLNPTNRLSFTFSAFPHKVAHANLNTFDPPNVTEDYKQRGYVGEVQARKIFSNGSLLESLFSVMQFDVDAFPANIDSALPPYPGAPELSVSSQVMILQPELNSGSYFNNQHRASRRYQWQEIYHFRPFQGAGQHLLKAGLDISHSNFDAEEFSKPVRVERSDGSLAELIAFTGPGQVGRSITDTGAFIQDEWKPDARLLFNLGLRYDHDTVSGTYNLGPRFSFALALTPDGRTVLRGGVGRFFDKMPLEAAAFDQLQSRQVTDFAADGVTPLGPTLDFQNRILRRLDVPRSLSWSGELDRKLWRGLVLRSSYQQRQTHRDFVVEPVETPQPVLLLGNTGESIYREYQVAADWKFGEEGRLLVSYIRSRAYGDLNTFDQFFGNLENPIIRPNERSLLPFDAPNSFLSWSQIRLRWGIYLVPLVEVHDGYPFSLIDARRDFVGPRNRAGRFPTFFTLNLGVTKTLPFHAFGKKHRARLGVKFLNLTDHFNPMDFQNNIDSQPVTFRDSCTRFGQFCSSHGLTLRGEFVLDF